MRTDQHAEYTLRVAQLEELRAKARAIRASRVLSTDGRAAMSRDNEREQIRLRARLRVLARSLADDIPSTAVRGAHRGHA